MLGYICKRFYQYNLPDLNTNIILIYCTIIQYIFGIKFQIRFILKNLP